MAKEIVPVMILDGIEVAFAYRQQAKVSTENVSGRDTTAYRRHGGNKLGRPGELVKIVPDNEKAGVGCNFTSGLDNLQRHW